MNFDYSTSLPSLCTPVTMGAVAAIHEYKGKQELYQALKPEPFEKLAAVARVQSIGSSNKIEGIETTDVRLEALAAEKVAPHNRNEREIAGYRYVLDLIHERYAHMTVTPNLILQLHRDLYRYEDASFAGKWKDSDNAIVERLTDGTLRTRFVPTSAVVTPGAVESLCQTYNESIKQGVFSPLLCVAQFIFDFVSIHPFSDGNGRMSRLLMLLMLYQNGYTVGKYLSLEREIERTKQTYYEVLQESSAGWAARENDYLPFVTYFLGIVFSRYRELDERLNVINAPNSSEELIRDCLAKAIVPISKREIQKMCPTSGARTIERTLQKMVKEGAVLKVGAARATCYQLNWQVGK